MTLPTTGPDVLALCWVPLRVFRHPGYFFAGIALVILVNVALDMVDRFRRKR